MTNPLLEPWDTPFELPPFDRIEDAHFEPAIETALAEARAAVAEIADQTEPPGFENTVEALETAFDRLDRVLSVFYGVSGADSTEAREALLRDVAPRLSHFTSELYANRPLFDRIETLWQARDDLGLDPEAARLLYLTRRRFVRLGAQLGDADAKELREVNARLSTLGTRFTQNLLADERGWRLPLAEADLDGLPDFLRAALRGVGEGKPVLTVSRSLLVPFLQYSPRRDLRQKAWEAWSARGAMGGETDNRAIAAEILALRSRRAQLLGHDDYASWKLETEMAGNADAVRDLLMQVWTPASAAAEADAEKLTALLHADGEPGPLRPWDWRFYSERLRKELHDLDEAELKSYLSLDRMLDAAFSVAGRLFGLEFAPADVPLYHADARAWDVSRDGQHLAVLITDYFARPSKRSGAWCGAFRDQGKLGGDTRPVVYNVCNFAKPEDGQPALLSHDDARTLFHEFGHALHHMLSDVRYESMSGTSVARDFVELPSQLYEHWLDVPEVLREFATHVETGAPMPEALLDKVQAAATFDTGFQTVEYVASALVDLAFHVGAPPTDPMQKQAEVLQEIGMPQAIGMRHATPHFAHVFAGDGYAAGYYSYMWSEVMDADAFAAFEEAGGPFDPDVARKLEKVILSSGGSVEAAALYERFRGRMPGVEPLLKGRGLAA